MSTTEAGVRSTDYGDQLERAHTGKSDLHFWFAGPESRIGAGFMQLALRETDVNADAPAIDLSPLRDYDPQYGGVMSAEKVANNLQAYREAVDREAESRELLLSGMNVGGDTI